jgi:hypothetical protein
MFISMAYRPINLKIPGMCTVVQQMGVILEKLPVVVPQCLSMANLQLALATASVVVV